MNKSKKIISILSAVALTVSALTLTGCSDDEYKGEPITGYDSTGAISSNGGFLAEKGDYLYFINGQQNYTADNTYGEVVKGALMRISKAQLAAGEYTAAQIVVPSLLVSGDYNAGVYIYGDYVYYATPTTDKNNDGEIENSQLDFKRAKLDGSEAPMGDVESYFFRLTSNTTEYRYVKNENSDTVYCLYEQDGALKSYNVDTGVTNILVKGASEYYYDAQDATNPNVYYAMSVQYDSDSANPTNADYNQIYCVNAASYAVTDAGEASYTVMNGDKTIAKYDFDAGYFNKKNQEAEDNDEEEMPYNLGDYTTYPYVNLGELVLDGVSRAGNPGGDNRYNQDASSIASASEFGYTYTIQSHTNGGLYFKRAPLVKNGSETEKLYYIPSARTEWNSVTANDLSLKKMDVVSDNLTNASATALYIVEETPAGDRMHAYFHVADGILKRTAFMGGVEATSSIAYELSDITLWQVRGEYLYYYGSGTNGKNLSRINYTGDQGDYNFMGDEKYKPVTIPLVDWNDSWYKPEFVTVGEKEFLLYSNAQSYGSGGVSYDYIYATELGTNAELTARQEKIDDINEEIDSYKDNADLQNLMKYYFRTGETAAYESVKDLYKEYDQEEFAKFIEKFGEGKEFENCLEKNFIGLVGRLNADDSESIANNWTNYLLSETEEEETEEDMPTWAIILIVCGGTLFVAIVAFVAAKKIKSKKAQKRREEAVINAYKHKKIDTTDDKSIDVYADEESEDEAAEDISEVVEEATEEVEEAPTQE